MTLLTKEKTKTKLRNETKFLEVGKKFERRTLFVRIGLAPPQHFFNKMRVK